MPDFVSREAELERKDQEIGKLRSAVEVGRMACSQLEADLDRLRLDLAETMSAFRNANAAYDAERQIRTRLGAELAAEREQLDLFRTAMRSAIKVGGELEAQLAAQREAARVLREALGMYAEGGSWTYLPSVTQATAWENACTVWRRGESGFTVAQQALAAANKVLEVSDE